MSNEKLDELLRSIAERHNNLSGAELSRRIGYERTALAHWRKKGKLPLEAIEELHNKKLADDQTYYELLKASGYPMIGKVQGNKDAESTETDPKESGMMQILKKYTSSNLDFVGCCHYGKLEFATNRTLEARLESALLSKAAHESIEMYCTIANKVHELIDNLNDHFEQLEQGILIRTIFDVEQGGFFYYHLRDGIYAFGVTVDQTAMDDDSADHEMRALVAELKRYMRLSR